MSFLVAQMRKTTQEDGTYMTRLSGITIGTVRSPDPFETIQTENTYFTDLALEGTFTAGEVYYLRFKIHKVPQYYYSGSIKGHVNAFQQADNLNFSLLLKNVEQTDEEAFPPELISTFSVPRAFKTEKESYASYSFVFSPSKNFDRLVFRLSRINYDKLATSPRNWLIEQLNESFSPSEIISVARYTADIDETPSENIQVQGIRMSYEGDDGDVCVLNNIVPKSKASKQWIKFGYQSRPGSLIVVNGEPIRVGRSGIYEINNGTKIKSFMIASPGGSSNSKIDAFLLDYAYSG